MPTPGPVTGWCWANPWVWGCCQRPSKKGQLDAPGYARMIATTTQLNTPGPDLAALDGVHALTDVTGFGLAGHALEMARGANCRLHLHWPSVPLIDGVAALAAQGLVTGASARNWAGYGAQVQLPPGKDTTTQALLTDPQTSGGLLVACAPEAVDAVQAVFARHGFAQAAVVGEVLALTAGDSPGVSVCL